MAKIVMCFGHHYELGDAVLYPMLKRIVPLLLGQLFPAILIHQAGWAQELSRTNEMEAQFQEIIQAMELQPAELTHAGRMMREEAPGDCYALQVGWALELYAAAFTSGTIDVEPCLREVAPCVEPYTRLHLFAGFLLYQQGRLEEALGQISLALLDDLVITEALDARGGLHALMGRYDLAVRDFERLIEANNDQTPPSAFVNLSGIHVVAKNWSEALRWTTAGLESIQRNKERSAPSSPQYIQLATVERALLANQLSAATRMGDRALAVATWQRMKLLDIEGEQLSNLKTILEFALADGRFQIYDFVVSKGGSRWSGMSESDWSQMGSMQLLLNPAWSDYFFEQRKLSSSLDSLKQRWSVMSKLWGLIAVEQQWSAGTELSMQESSSVLILWAILICATIIAAVTGVRLWRLQTGQVRWNIQKESIMEFIEAFEALGPNDNIDHLIIGLNRFLKHHRGGVDWMGLTEIEKEVLQATLAGLGTKAIAASSNRSPASVYNIRSRIRQKLNVPEDMSLDEWCMQFKSIEEK